MAGQGPRRREQTRKRGRTKSLHTKISIFSRGHMLFRPLMKRRFSLADCQADWIAGQSNTIMNYIVIRLSVCVKVLRETDPIGAITSTNAGNK
jgi:hypothetical protein